jgi:hypothetical protein
MGDLKDGGSALTGPGRFVLSYNREVVVDDVVHYYFEVRVGYSEYDVVGIHRVVRENRPWKPIRTNKSIFLQHGDAVGFTIFMFGVDSPSTPDELSAAVYFAQNDVDVWGIDQGWILVPQATADLSFMAGWGMQHQVDNLEVGLMIARFARLFTSNGWRKMHLLGYSSGVFTSFALLNQETQLPPGHRNVAGCGGLHTGGRAVQNGLRADPGIGVRDGAGIAGLFGCRYLRRSRGYFVSNAGNARQFRSGFAVAGGAWPYQPAGSLVLRGSDTPVLAHDAVVPL